MFPLKPKLSLNGFTSSDSYDHAVQCFLKSGVETIRCLHIDGVCGRRRSAFAHALANSLDASQVLYYEFGRDKPAPQIIRIQEGEEIIEEPPVDALDRILTEACAVSEAEQTVLILDQLHETQFLNHIRLYEFLQSGVWHYSDVQYQANVLNLQVFMISDESLYHSLQSASFRLWVNDSNESSKQIIATDLGIDETKACWFSSLQDLLKQLGLSPTIDEYRLLIQDIEQRIHDEHQLKISLFGWLENVDRKKLDGMECRPFLDNILAAILQSKDVHEEIEILSIKP